MDRAGLSPNDGATHHGLFDLSYLRNIPRCSRHGALERGRAGRYDGHRPRLSGPAPSCATRAANAVGTPIKADARSPRNGQSTSACKKHGDIELWAIGSMVADAEQARGINLHAARHPSRCGQRPLRETTRHRATALLRGKPVKLIVTLEDNVISGGFGSAVMEALQDGNCLRPVEFASAGPTYLSNTATPSPSSCASASASTPSRFFKKCSSATAHSATDVA